MITEEQLSEYFELYDDAVITIDDDMFSVVGGVKLGRSIEKIPFQFKKVTGDFDCSESGLTTLEGCPVEVVGNFYCSNNKLLSLEGGPKIVKESYYCSTNPFTSLKGLPDECGEVFFCDWRKNLPLLSLLKLSNFYISKNIIVNDIMKKYRGQKPLRQAIIQCQKELIDAGYAENANL